MDQCGTGIIRLEFEPIDGTDSTLELADVGLLRIVNGHLVDLNAPNTPVDPQRYRLTTPEGLIFNLDQGFTIDSVVEPDGNELDFTPDGIAHSNGFALEFVRDPDGRIAEIRGPENTLLTYTYDLDGNLSSFTDQVGHTTQYTYVDPLDHFLEDIFDDLGEVSVGIDQEVDEGAVDFFSLADAVGVVDVGGGCSSGDVFDDAVFEVVGVGAGCDAIDLLFDGVAVVVVDVGGDHGTLGFSLQPVIAVINITRCGGVLDLG